MKEIREVRKKDIPFLMEDVTFWNHSFLSISKHRLWSHFHNPVCSDEDIVMLLAYIDNELVGYMGAYIDFITVEGKKQKIAWLSTWWVHPSTKGTGIGRMLLDTMFTKQKGQIGISQFTTSAKRVYDKSGYFTDLKSSKGIKAVIRCNSAAVMPILFPKLKAVTFLFRFTDTVFNFFINRRLWFCKRHIQSKLANVYLEYLPFPDSEVRVLVSQYGQNDISIKSNDFFTWLKSYHWVYEAPLIDMTNKKQYEFSMYDKAFDYYYVKINTENTCVGFVVLQKRGTTLKVLFVYCDVKEQGKLVADVIKQHAIEMNIREIICYEPVIVSHLFESSLFLYKKRKVKHSIISKSFGITNFSKTRVNYGDGDCCFA